MENFTTAEATLTENEKKVLVALIENLYAEPHFSDVNANEISDMTDIPTKSARGTISSLVKKGYIEVDKIGSEPTVYLHISKWYLHPNWKTSSEYESWRKSI
jgi:sugar-specific transcriptional regulator TrmB